MRATWLTALALMTGSTLAAQAPAPAPVDPIGQFQFEVKLPDGTAVSGRIIIRGQPGALQGSVTSDFAPEAPLADIAVGGQVLRFTVRPPDGTTVPVRLTFTGDEFTGTIEFGGVSVPVTGKRVKVP